MNPLQMESLQKKTKAHGSDISSHIGEKCSLQTKQMLSRQYARILATKQGKISPLHPPTPSLWVAT